MPNELRKFNRVRSNSFCLVETEAKIIKAVFIDYSQMGALLRIEKNLSAKKQISLIYPNEKSEFIKMAGYSVYATQKNGLYFLGVQFIALVCR
jgi:c-di-GMP-binding flagellar brake protein YcgR